MEMQQHCSFVLFLFLHLYIEYNEIRVDNVHLYLLSTDYFNKLDLPTQKRYKEKLVSTFHIQFSIFLYFLHKRAAFSVFLIF